MPGGRSAGAEDDPVTHERTGVPGRPRDGDLVADPEGDWIFPEPGPDADAAAPAPPQGAPDEGEGNDGVAAAPAAGTADGKDDTAGRPVQEQRAAAPPGLWLFLGLVLVGVSLFVLWGASRDAPVDALTDAPPTAALPGDAAAREALAGEEDPAEAADGPADEGTPGPVADTARTAAMLALEGLPASSDCTDLFADAQAIHAYADTLLADGAWPDIVASRLLQRVVVEEMGRSCGAPYASRLVEYLLADPAAEDAVVYALQEQVNALPEARPAPPGAILEPAFRTADGNISCTVTHDGAGCSITLRQFENPPACPGPATGAFSVALHGQEVLPCAGTIAGGDSVLADGQTSTAGYYACTARQSSVECWHTVSGTGFSLAPDGFTPID